MRASEAFTVRPISSAARHGHYAMVARLVAETSENFDHYLAHLIQQVIAEAEALR